jgi:hypothetical protein
MRPDMDDLDTTLRALNAERYGRNHWWASVPSEHPEIPGARPSFDDSELACSRRRRDAAADYDKTFRKASA